MTTPADHHTIFWRWRHDLLMLKFLVVFWMVKLFVSVLWACSHNVCLMRYLLYYVIMPNIIMYVVWYYMVPYIPYIHQTYGVVRYGMVMFCRINYIFSPSQKSDDCICEGYALICTFFHADKITTQMQTRSWIFLHDLRPRSSVNDCTIGHSFLQMGSWPPDSYTYGAR